MLALKTELLNVQQSAAFLGVHPATIRRWAKTSQLNGVKVGSRGDWRFTKDGLSKLSHKPSIQEEQKKFAKIQQLLTINANAIQKLATVHHASLIGGDPLPDEHYSKYQQIHVKIVVAIAQYLDDFEAGAEAFKVLGVELANEAVKDGLSIEEAVDGTIFLKQSIWKKLEETGLLNELSTQDLYQFSQRIGSYCDVLASKIAFSYHKMFTENTLASEGRFKMLTDKSDSDMKESEERLRLALEAGQIGVWDWNIQTNTIVWSDRVYGFYGANRKEFEVTYENFSKYIHPDDKAMVDIAVQKAVEGVQEYNIAYRILTVQGEVRWITSRAVVTRDAMGKPLRMLGATSDITEQKKLEQNKNDFVSIATHELKTPVTSLKAYAEVLQRMFVKEGDHPSASHLGKMNAQLDKLATLINSLLDSIKIDTGNLYMREELFEFDPLVHEIVEEMQRTTDTHVIRTTGSTKKKIFADRDRVGQVLTNLLSNAIKYSPHSPTVMVELRGSLEAVTVQVEDFGVGIEQKKLPFVFERFYRGVDKQEMTFPGLGLGLYISSEIIKREGGKIWAESEVGKGSVFCFSLPLEKNTYAL